MSLELSEQDEPFPLAEALTRTAFYACLVLMLMRLSISEQLRDSFDLGMTAPPAPGPTTTLLLNLACFAPALLILMRRAIDRGYTLRTRRSHLPLLLLAIWVATSCFWASDRFAAVVSASTWCGATAVAWAMSQLVRSWSRLRFVAAAVFGALMIQLVQVGTYSFYEAPELVREWDATLKQQLLQAQNLTADSPTAIQLDRNVRQAAVLAFYRSPNTVAAVALFGAIICAALALQRSRDGKEPVLIASPVLAALLAIPVLLATGSRTAQGLAAFAVLTALIAFALRRTLLRRRTQTYAVVVVAAVLLGVGIVATGTLTGGLLHDSLTFRWRYWVGSFALVLDRPWLGVGWENFGAAYLQHRVAGAVEEIKDPHNLFVKFAAETGIIGVALLFAWLLITGRELSRRTSGIVYVKAGNALRPVVIVVASFATLHVLTRGVALLNILDLLKLVLFAALLGGALLLGSVRSVEGFVFDRRRARWLAGGTTLALGIFLAHNTVDFALFETGPMLLFMTALGASLGVRQFPRNAKRNNTACLSALAIVSIATLAFALLVVLPVMLAEQHAAAARVLAAEGRADRAAIEWRAALAASPVPNADYALHAADSYRQSPSPRPREMIAFLTQAVEADPHSVKAWLERARVRQTFGPVDNESERDAIESDYRVALKLDPASIDSRLELARFLDAVGRPTRALKEYRLALRNSDRLPQEEIRRLPADVAAQVRERIAVVEPNAGAAK